MADRMTEQQEAELRYIAAGPGEEFLAQALRELDATRSALADLVTALPKCSICDKPATRDGNEFARHLCDDSHGMWGAAPELPYAKVLRRLAREGGGK